MKVMGVDTGINGGACIMEIGTGEILETIRFSRLETEHNYIRALQQLCAKSDLIVIETVSVHQDAGRKSIWTQAYNYSMIINSIRIFEIQNGSVKIVQVSAKNWQKALGIEFEKDKTNYENRKKRLIEIAKDKHKELSFNKTVWKELADCILIAEYGRSLY